MRLFHKTGTGMLNNLWKEVFSTVWHLESGSHSASFFIERMVIIIFVILNIKFMFWGIISSSVYQIGRRSFCPRIFIAMRVKRLNLSICLVEALLSLLVTDVFSEGCYRIEFINSAVI